MVMVVVMAVVMVAVMAAVMMVVVLMVMAAVMAVVVLMVMVVVMAVVLMELDACCCQDRENDCRQSDKGKWLDKNHYFARYLYTPIRFWKNQVLWIQFVWCLLRKFHQKT